MLCIFMHILLYDRKKVCVCSIFSSKGVLDLMPGLDKLAGSFLMELYSLHSPGMFILDIY
jgi:hypothetical protein